jgi:hypothetical protein
MIEVMSITGHSTTEMVDRYRHYSAGIVLDKLEKKSTKKRPKKAVLFDDIRFLISEFKSEGTSQRCFPLRNDLGTTARSSCLARGFFEASCSPSFRRVGGDGGVCRGRWTKLTLIATYAPVGAEATWLELARSGASTAKELKSKLKGVGWGEPKAHSVLLRLCPTQYKIFGVLQKLGAKPARKGMLSAHDIDRFATLLADDCVNHQVSAAAPPPAAGGTPTQGTARFFAGP